MGKKIFQSNNLIFYIKIVKKEEEKTLNKQKEGNNKDETEIHETENRKIGGEINETKGWFFEINNLINKDLARLIKINREMAQITDIRNATRDTMTYPAG